ncbi:MAG: three-Cys-motif partner protein TcmP [Verrucomicrobiales bacterium]
MIEFISCSVQENGYKRCMAVVSSKQFGGGWSDHKLDALRSYLNSYIIALSNSPFERVYIDAFAGAGIRDVVKNAEEGLFDEQFPEEDAGYRHGSPLIALGMEPAFHRFVFIEQDPESLGILREQVSDNFPDKLRLTSFMQGDANEVLQGLAEEQWRTRRAVAFLRSDCPSRGVETIEKIARTKAIDMWLLFPAMAVNRMLPRAGSSRRSGLKKLTETFGSDEWQAYFYKKQEADLFGEEFMSKQPKVFEKLSEFITMRLNTVFEGATNKPLILKNSSGAPLFLLCFASGNPKGAPIALRIANHIINKKNHGQ